MRKSILKQLSAACLMSLLVPCGAFATVFVDHFDTPEGGQSLTLTGTGTASSFTSGLGSSTMSGTRYLEISKDAASSGGSHAVDINNAAYSSIMADSLESGAIGSTKVIWDGNSNSTIDYNVLSAIDFTEGGLNSYIDLRLISNDKPGTITLNFGDGTNNSDYTITLPDYSFSYPYDLLIPFTEWASVDFTKITGAGMSIDLLTSEDLRIDFVGSAAAPAPVPEPATFLLLGGGILGVALMKRRSKKENSLVSTSETVPSF